MNQRIALGLSIVGVLATGSAAALVNTQILSAGAEQSAQAQEIAAQPAVPIVLTVDPNTGVVEAPDTAATSPTSGGGSAQQPATPAPAPARVSPPVDAAAVQLQELVDTTDSATTPSTTVAPTTTIPTSSTTAPPASSVSYRVGSAGEVTVDTSGDLLRLTSVQHEAGWVVWQAVQLSPSAVQVTFRSSSMEVRFRASLAFGVVTPTIESTSLATTPPTSSAAGAYYDDDDDHDGYDHDDDDDDDHDDDDDDQEDGDDHEEDRDDD